MLGPFLAPSSPPLTPMPMYRMPFSSITLLCLSSVFWYHSFPPSMIASPGSRCPSRDSMVASTGAPALTSRITFLGLCRDCTKSPRSSYPVSLSPSFSLPALLTHCSVFAYERLYTLIGNPFEATFSARFWPMTARPTRPTSAFAVSFPLIALPAASLARAFAGVVAFLRGLTLKPRCCNGTAAARAVAAWNLPAGTRLVPALAVAVFVVAVGYTTLLAALAFTFILFFRSVFKPSLPLQVVCPSRPAVEVLSPLFH
mmetsp:Transcript_4987/g.17502  ORF Transcript_4987/g.17502 Transcript_4987/m.17502 type:complete len:257 (-) Transcript_4987:82-852(-)